MQSTKSQNIEITSNNGNEENTYEKDICYSSSHDNNYNESTQNLERSNPVEGYYTVTGDDNPSMDINNIPYIAHNINESRITMDPRIIHEAPISNQSLMYQNNGIPTDFSQYQLFNKTNTMYGRIPQYYGGMQIPMNPYYDPYGIINPLSCAPLNTEKKKKTKKFYCC